MTDVSKEELRRFYINYHGLGEFFELSDTEAMSAIFGRIRSVQFDPLDVVGRNAELVMFARNANITRGYFFDELYERRDLVDGWDKMMSIYPASEFEKFGFVRRACVKQYSDFMSWRGQSECHGYTEDIFDYIEKHGTTLVKDIPSPKTNNAGWGPSKVAGVCCEYLWHGGRISVASKKGVIKYFDTTKRLLGIDGEGNAFDDFDEFMRWYTARRVASVGAARAAKGGTWLGVYLENDELRKKAIDELVERGEIVAIRVGGERSTYYINAGSEKFFGGKPLDRAVLLGPLDNMIWDRAAIKSIFGFEYGWEVYTPQAKRKYGYYVLPVLLGDRFVARIEPVLDKKREMLFVKNVWFEKDCAPTADTLDKIECELKRLAAFLNASPSPNIRAMLALR